MAQSYLIRSETSLLQTPSHEQRTARVAVDIVEEREGAAYRASLPVGCVLRILKSIGTV